MHPLGQGDADRLQGFPVGSEEYVCVHVRVCVWCVLGVETEVCGKCGIQWPGRRVGGPEGALTGRTWTLSPAVLLSSW